MRPHSDQYPEEAYRAGDDREGGGRPDGRPGDRRNSYLPAWDWGGASGLWPWASRGTGADESGNDSRQRTGATGGRLARVRDEGLIAMLIVVGAILFAIPGPATSALGIVLVALGVLAWLVDRAL